MDNKIKSLVRESINEKKEEVIRHFKYLFEYPFHQDTTFILLEVRGDGGDFGVTITQMNGWGKQLTKNAYGEYATLGSFGFRAYRKFERDFLKELREDDELIEDIDDYVKDYLVPFFQECFDQAGGKNAKIPFYLFYPNSGDAYDLVKEEWTYPD